MGKRFDIIGEKVYNKTIIMEVWGCYGLIF